MKAVHMGWVAIALLLLSGCSEPVARVTLSSNAGQLVFGETDTAFGGRSYELWLPPDYGSRSSMPLMVMLHGCTQSAGDFAAGTRMNEVANEHGFLVLYPQQSTAANGNRCWNWFEPEHQSRGAGEPEILAAMIRQVRDEYNVHHRRIFVAGLSAGGAMATILAVAYPDVISGVGVAAGLEYEAATSLLSGLVAMQAGGPDPRRQGRLAYARMGELARRMPVIVFHGDSDLTVAPVNARQVIAQWAKTNDLAFDGRDNDAVGASPARVDRVMPAQGYAYTRSVFHDAKDKLLMELWMIDGMRHAWPGGSSDGSYADPLGPDASREMWGFFTRAR